MPSGHIFWCMLIVPGLTIAQSPPPAQSPQPSYANYSIMLVNPAGGSAVVLMHNPKNELEFVDASKTGQAFSAGYVPVRAAEIAETIASLREQVSQLSAENQRLQPAPADTQPHHWESVTPQVQAVAPAAPSGPTAEQIEAQRMADAAAARRQALILGLLMMNANRPQPYRLPDPNANRLKTNCATQYVGNAAYTNCN